MTTLTINQFEQELNKLLLENNNLFKFKQAVATSIIETISLKFVDEEDPYGVAWAKLKVRQGSILRKTGLLNKSITYKINGTYIDFGTNLPYAPTHQYGATIYPKTKKALYFQGASHPFKKAVIPARPFLPNEQKGLPLDWQEAIRNVFKIFLKD